MTVDAALPQLEKEFNKDQLLSGWGGYASRFYLAHPGEWWGEVRAEYYRDLLGAKKVLNKTELTQLSFSVLRNKEIYDAFLATLPPFVPVLIEKLLWEEALDRRQVEAIAGIPIVAERKRDWGPVVIRAEFAFFHHQIHNAYSFGLTPANARISTLLPRVLRDLITPFYPAPEGYHLVPAPPPEAAGLSRFSAEGTILRELPALITYYGQDQIKYSEKGKPNPNGMRKLQRTLRIAEFFPPESDFPTTRSFLLAGLLYGYKPGGQAGTVPDTLRHLFGRHLEKNLAAQYLITRLKGMGHIQTDAYNPHLTGTLRGIFAALPADGWITTRNLKQYARTRFLDLTPVDRWEIHNKLHFEEQVPGSRLTRRFDIEPAGVPPFLHDPVLKGGAFLFAAFGLLELSYGPPPAGRFGADWYSEFDNLYAVRLTALGAYVLGRTDAYEAPETDAAVRLVPDTDSLMIRVEGAGELAEVLLANYARKVSETRYQLVPGLFLKDCKTKKDVAGKITLFRQAIGAALPPFWEDYLRRLAESHSLVRPQPHMRVYRLPPDNRELHRLLVQDEVLKLMVTKAERFHILVDTKEEAAFRARLKELGILLE